VVLIFPLASCGELFHDSDSTASAILYALANSSGLNAGFAEEIEFFLCAAMSQECYEYEVSRFTFRDSFYAL
jgi:hypothetical protein